MTMPLVLTVAALSAVGAAVTTTTSFPAETPPEPVAPTVHVADGFTAAEPVAGIYATVDPTAPIATVPTVAEPVAPVRSRSGVADPFAPRAATLPPEPAGASSPFPARTVNVATAPAGGQGRDVTSFRGTATIAGTDPRGAAMTDDEMDALLDAAARLDAAGLHDRASELRRSASARGTQWRARTHRGRTFTSDGGGSAVGIARTPRAPQPVRGTVIASDAPRGVIAQTSVAPSGAPATDSIVHEIRALRAEVRALTALVAELVAAQGSPSTSVGQFGPAIGAGVPAVPSRGIGVGVPAASSRGIGAGVPAAPPAGIGTGVPASTAGTVRASDAPPARRPGLSGDGGGRAGAPGASGSGSGGGRAGAPGASGARRAPGAGR